MKTLVLHPVNTDNDAVIQKAVRIAQTETKDWHPGHIVAHPSEKKAAKLEAIKEDLAQISFTDGRRLSFPLSEVFDPNRANTIAMEIRFGLRTIANAN